MIGHSNIEGEIGFVLIGFGRIGQRHFKYLKQNPHARVVAIVDIDEQASKRDTYPADVPFYTSIQEAVDAKLDFDVVDICTPNGSHCELALSSLDQGKHTIIEKPMGLNKAECESVIYKALQVSRQVFVVKQNRYSPPSKWLKDVVSKKLLGDIYSVQINCYWNRNTAYYEPGGWHGTLKQDGGVLFTQFSHFIDLMYWVFGDIKNIQTRLKTYKHGAYTEFPDTGTSSFEFVNGGIGMLNFSTAVYQENLESSITVIGSKGSLKIGGQYMNEIKYCNIEGYAMPEIEASNAPNDYGAYKGSAANHGEVISNVINTLHGTDVITANALEGTKVVEIIERIYAAEHGK